MNEVLIHICAPGGNVIFAQADGSSGPELFRTISSNTVTCWPLVIRVTTSLLSLAWPRTLTLLATTTAWPATSGTVLSSGAGAFFFGCGAVAGDSVCSSSSFFSIASRSLAFMSASAAQSGSRAAQYAVAQTTRTDFEICIRPFLRQKGRLSNSFPGGNQLFPCPGPGIKQHGPQPKPPDLTPADFDSPLRVEGITGAQELEGLPPD